MSQIKETPSPSQMLLSTAQLGKAPFCFKINKNTVESQTGAFSYDLRKSTWLAPFFENHGLSDDSESISGTISFEPSPFLAGLSHSSQKHDTTDSRRNLCSISFNIRLQAQVECIKCLENFTAELQVNETLRVLLEREKEREKESQNHAESHGAHHRDSSFDAPLLNDSNVLDEYEVSQEGLCLDLVLHDLVEAALPNYPVCSNICQGLCLECGANLNNQDNLVSGSNCLHQKVISSFNDCSL